MDGLVVWLWMCLPFSIKHILKTTLQNEHVTGEDIWRNVKTDIPADRLGFVKFTVTEKVSAMMTGLMFHSFIYFRFTTSTYWTCKLLFYHHMVPFRCWNVDFLKEASWGINTFLINLFKCKEFHWWCMEHCEQFARSSFVTHLHTARYAFNWQHILFYRVSCQSLLNVVQRVKGYRSLLVSLVTAPSMTRTFYSINRLVISPSKWHEQMTWTVLK